MKAVGNSNAPASLLIGLSISGRANLETPVRGEIFYPPVPWVAPSDCTGGALEEGATQFHGTIDFGKIDELKQLLDRLSAEEIDILHLAAKGYSHDQICWLLNTSIQRVRQCSSKAEGMVGADMLPQAGLITSMRQSTLENRYARHLAKSLMGLVDARVMRVIVDETHCGLQLMAATGQHVKLWFCADDELDKPGWASLATLDGEFVYEDEMLGLAEQVASLVGRGRNSTETAKQILHDIAEKAVELLDQIDDDCDLESNGDDWETEAFEDEDEAPLSLNPRYQTEREIEIASLRGPVLDRRVGLRTIASDSPGANIGSLRHQEPLEGQQPIDFPPLLSPSIGHERGHSISATAERESELIEAEGSPPQCGDTAQEISQKLARLEQILREIDMAPDRGRAFAKIRHDLEIQELTHWLRRRGVDLSLGSPIWERKRPTTAEV